MLLVHISYIFYLYNATLVKSVYCIATNSVLTNKLHIATRLKRDSTLGKVHSTIIFICLLTLKNLITLHTLYKVLVRAYL